MVGLTGTRGRLAILAVVASGASPAGGCGGDDDESRHYSLQATQACLQGEGIQAKRVGSRASEGELMASSASSRGFEARLAFGKDAAEAKSLENGLRGEAFLFALISSSTIVGRKGNVAFYVRDGQVATVEGCLR